MFSVIFNFKSTENWNRSDKKQQHLITACKALLWILKQRTALYIFLWPIDQKVKPGNHTIAATQLKLFKPLLKQATNYKNNKSSNNYSWNVWNYIGPPLRIKINEIIKYYNSY